MYEFDAKKMKDKVVQWIREFFEKNGPKSKAVVAISGGKDSSVVAALCVEALGKDRVFGVLLPQGQQADIDASLLLVKHLGIDYKIINIKETCDAMEAAVEASLEGGLSKQAKTNMPARIRMATTYAVSQTLDGRVANTCNLSEDWVGYATRYGDGAGDFSPLSKFTVQEVKAIGRELGLPEELVDKVPIDGLSGLTDEENLGFTYADLDRYLREGVCEPELKKKLDSKRRGSKFKLEIMPSYNPEIPILAEDK